MKKRFLSLVAVIVAATATYAQNSLIAVLSHEGEVSTFYGNTALRDAHDAADHGDVITLSSGTFTAVNITKAVTIRGAGMEVNSETGAMPTIIMGDFRIDITTETDKRFTLEGIYHDNTINYDNILNNPTFMKCRLSKISYAAYANNHSVISNATIIHCNIVKEFNISGFSSASIINSYVYNPHFYYTTGSLMEFSNCVIDFRSELDNSTISNCIIYNHNYYGYLESSCNVYNSIGEKSTSGVDIFKNIPNNTNVCLNNGEVANLFKEGSFYELTENALEQYATFGTDGTQVGIYGGNLPFDARPTNPQITKCNVAAKSTADGKLSVDIEVEAAE